MESYELTTLKKGLLILDLLRNKHSLTMNEVMDELSLNKSSAYRMLYTLEKMEYVLKYDKYFHLNPKIFNDKRINIYKGIQWISLVTPYHLARGTGETVYIGILDQYELVIKNVIKSPFNEPLFEAIDKRTPIHSSAIGKSILAHLSPQRQREILNGLSLENLTKNSFVDKELFISHLNIIKMQGYAVDNEETNIGKRCIAAPVYLNEEVIGSIAIHGEVEQIKKNSIRSLAKKVIQFSKQLTHELENLTE
ncbi:MULTISPECIES: IclR family transcriptional regulator [Priestia]|uniref:IclR family transcriptional regulator n=1 Tax=Priestia TaxID=2800373 RepID=UPI001FB52441|nr:MULTISPECIES: IclR family transcriptional regulator [Priestia]MCU7741398.1 IclR family transcriptional regulator [Priestia megaterium]WDC91154.1 IclR family transcriptional regulator [Priestia megaterium]